MLKQELIDDFDDILNNINFDKEIKIKDSNLKKEVIGVIKKSINKF